MIMNSKKVLFCDILGQKSEIVKLPEQGCTSEVCKIVSENGQFILKSATKEKYREWLRTEAEVLKALSLHHTIPVPKFYGFLENEDASHLLMSYEDGITLTAALKAAETMEEKQTLVQSFGQFLSTLHAQEPVFKTEADWLETQLIRARLYAETGQADGSLALLEQLEEDKPQKVKQTMIHGDCTTDNVLAVNGQVRLFIDVAGMTVGDPRYDEALAIRKFRDTPELLASFYDGYTRYRVSDQEYCYFEEGLYEFF
ncbi:phosphotransferase family protein [Mesobacillus jeotgali]|uniref:phosphotransferase family protein n=1 Tax=Mesobacillus jeotgali TaxID=129985 RepID=UPI00111742D1|nr:aminoglycoside phosphotransferase family protein [Mesobacillus jeotgali]